MTDGSAEQAGRLSELQAELLRLDCIPALREVPEMAMKLMPMIDQIIGCIQGEGRQDERDWFLQLRQMIAEASDTCLQ